VSATVELERHAAAAAGTIAAVEPITTTRALKGPFDYRLPAELRGRVAVGSTLVIPFARRRVLGVVVAVGERSEVAQERLLEPLRVIEPGLPAELVSLARWVAREYCSTFSRALTLVLAPGATRRLGGRKRAEVERPAHLAVGVRSIEPPQLTAEQHEVLEPLLAQLRGGTGSGTLLHGVTGSGKTEVYLRAAAAALEQGRGAIVLVPEIALTPQIVARFIDRFGDTVAVLHSQMRPAQRYDEWRRLRDGRARVCVGPRSAVFAPVQRLGLIVVDEEHDGSYKHEGDPRYDARDVAAERARAAGAVLLLGSATPRAESVERLPVRTLATRVDGRPLPHVEVLDMRGQGTGLHPLTAQALAETRAHGRKAIVLLNRRGWANFVSCRSCGHVWSCPDCDVTLVLHRREEAIACHHCGHREQAPARCSECGSTSVARHGEGTERLEFELARAFDDGSFPVFRLDADVLAGARAGSGGAVAGAGEGAAALLRRFEQAERGALVGTQMVAKGHDFTDVGLAVVLDADATLRFPDFRAEERTFSLIAQLAGRAGRGAQGRVLVQTIAPEARAIVHAAGHDSSGFTRGELERRRALGYPPFSHLIRVICAAEESARARAAAVALAESLAGLEHAARARVLGPAALFRLRGRERQALIVKAPERHPAVEAVGDAVAGLAAARTHRKVAFSVDVDPQ
jgi:primosomal protein N' (replication factor Y)